MFYLLNKQGSNFRGINQRSRLFWCHKQILCSFLFLPYSLGRKCVVHLCGVWAGNPLTSVQFSHSVMSYSLWFHGLQHARLPCPSQTPGACSNSCPLTQWRHLTIPSSVTPFSSCLQSFPTSGSFPVSQFFELGDQSIGVSTSASVLPMNIQDWFPLGLTGLSPCSSRDSQESSPIPKFKSIDSSALSFLYSPSFTFIHDYWICIQWVANFVNKSFEPEAKAKTFTKTQM